MDNHVNNNIFNTFLLLNKQTPYKITLESRHPNIIFDNVFEILNPITDFNFTMNQ